MAKELDGKLELLFAYLSINNVRHIQPLLLEAVDEYQVMKENMTYEEKKNVNLIKSLLWHAERGEWNEAKSHLTGAQTAYQEYINRTATANGQQNKGYTEIHGKNNSYLNIYKNAKKDPNDYMLRNSQFDPLEPRLKNQHEDKRLYTSNPRLPGTRMWSARGPRGECEEQGPTDQKPRRASLDNRRPEALNMGPDYPGQYSKPTETKVDSSKEGLRLDNKLDSSRSDASKIEEAQTLSGRLSSAEATPKVSEDDPNRPTKIADSFTALYTTQWKHAFDALKTGFVRDEQAIQYLLDILMECFTLCSEESQSQVLEFEKAAINILTNGKYSEDEKQRIEKKGDAKVMIKYRKEVADLSVKRLQELFLTKSLPVINGRHEIRQNDATDHYVRECVAVSWRMVIQDPPLHVVETRDIDKVYFDSRLYKPYSKSGSRVKYFVWPILQVYKGGPILARGIAQGDF